MVKFYNCCIHGTRRNESSSSEGRIIQLLLRKPHAEKPNERLNVKSEEHRRRAQMNIAKFNLKRKKAKERLRRLHQLSAEKRRLKSMQDTPPTAELDDPIHGRHEDIEHLPESSENLQESRRNEQELDDLRLMNWCIQDELEKLMKKSLEKSAESGFEKEEKRPQMDVMAAIHLKNSLMLTPEQYKALRPYSCFKWPTMSDIRRSMAEKRKLGWL